jgi:hypothetical protein
MEDFQIGNLIQPPQFLKDQEFISDADTERLYTFLCDYHEVLRQNLSKDDDQEVINEQGERIVRKPNMKDMYKDSIVRTKNAFKLVYAIAHHSNIQTLVQEGLIDNPAVIHGSIQTLTQLERLERADADGDNVVNLSHESILDTFNDPLKLKELVASSEFSMDYIVKSLEMERLRFNNIFIDLLMRSRLDEDRRADFKRRYMEIIEYLGLMQELNDVHYRFYVMDPTMSVINIRSMYDLESDVFKNDDVTKALLTLVRLLANGRWKRGPKSGWLYRQHYINDTTPSGYWVKTISIKEWIRNVTSWTNVTAAGGVKDLLKLWKVALNHTDLLVRKLVESVQDDLLPTVSPTRGVYGFNNGIFDVNKLWFFEYGTQPYKNYVETRKLHLYIYMFYEADFDTEGFIPETGCYDLANRLPPQDSLGKVNWQRDRMPKGHWSKIKIPIFDDTVAMQNWDLHTEEMLKFSFGRTLFPLSRDAFQFAPILIGRPGSGKSTILNFPLSAVPAELTAIIPANAEETFGTQQLVSEDEKCAKHLAACTDMNGHFGIPVSSMNNMVSGEPFTTAAKNKDTRTTQRFITPWIFGSNGFFTADDQYMPSILRRYLPFHINGTVPQSDVLVTVDLIQSYMPIYLKVVAIVYHEFFTLQKKMPSKMKNCGNIWQFVSPSLKQNQTNAMAEVSHAARLMNNESWIEYTGNEKDILSIDTLRYVTQYYSAIRSNTGGSNGNSKQGNSDDASAQSATAGNNGRKRVFKPKVNTRWSPPGADKVEDAIFMLHPMAAIELFMSPACERRFSNNRELENFGIKCQLGTRIIQKSQKYVVGLRIKDKRIQEIKENLPQMLFEDDDDDDIIRVPVTRGKATTAARPTASAATRNLPSRPFMVDEEEEDPSEFIITEDE